MTRMLLYRLKRPERTIIAEVPHDLRPPIERLASTMAAMSWPSRSEAFIEVWHDQGALGSPASRSERFQGIITAVLEWLDQRAIRNVEQAAWTVLTTHPGWVSVARSYLRSHRQKFAALCNGRPAYLEIVDEI